MIKKRFEQIPRIYFDRIARLSFANCHIFTSNQ